MTRRAHSTTPEPPRAAKRPRLDGERALTAADYRDGVVLAPMVRSGALPTRLFALKHGAKLVWGPEIIDKAILHAERVVDPTSGAISYLGKSKPMFTTHPLERPYYIFQIGSASPALAVQAARVVWDDVAGIDLNCGCPKPFSTSGGMGAALLSTPDLLCDILVALRSALPPRVALSAKIRFLPSQEDTLKLVERIVATGITALTVHCRTRNMRKQEPAVLERLREIVHFVEGLNPDVAVLANGDCEGFEDAKRVREVTHAHSVMIATTAETNPTCFSPTPLENVEHTLVPPYIRLAKYLDNHWSSTKWCIAQFRAPHPGIPKPAHKAARDAIARAKSYADVLDMVGGPGAMASGKEEMDAIRAVLEAREAARAREEPPTAFEAAAATSARLAPEDVDAETAAHVAAMLGGPPNAHAAEPDAPAADGGPADAAPATPANVQPSPAPPASGAPHLATLSSVFPARVLEEQLATPTPAALTV